MGSIVTEALREDFRQTGMDITSTHYPGAGHMIARTNTPAMLADLRTFLQGVGI